MASHPLRGAAAIVGLGITPQGKVYGNTPLGFAVDAVRLALEDAGLARDDLDGLLLNPGLAWNDLGMGSFQLQQAMGLHDLRLSATMGLGGATACAMIQHAAQAIAAGLCTTVACVFSDAPLKPPAPERARTSSASAYGFVRGWEAAYGYFGVNAMYALVARRHMIRFGTTQDHLGAVAVAQRRWANLNPQAQLHEQPLTLEDYHRSRWVVEPFHLFDCCLVSNGGLAVIVTGRERARDRPKPPVWIRGMAQGHLGGDPSDTLASGAVLTRGPALAMADLTLGDVDLVELYDCYTFTVLVSLEDYGFCAKGEGGPYVTEYVTGPGARLAVNTGGGQLSSFYMWGMTPVSEAVIQLRGEGDRRQVPKHDVALVSGNGGVLSTHATLVLGRQPS
jgi:acetyl-CoA acetyltransferase